MVVGVAVRIEAEVVELSTLPGLEMLVEVSALSELCEGLVRLWLATIGFNSSCKLTAGGLVRTSPMLGRLFSGTKAFLV